MRGIEIGWSGNGVGWWIRIILGGLFIGIGIGVWIGVFIIIIWLLWWVGLEIKGGSGFCLNGLIGFRIFLFLKLLSVG